MKRAAIALSILSLFAAASAQQGDPALDDLAAPAAGPSELDILSEGANADFPDIDAVKARKPVSVTLRALNKVTAKYSDLVINIGETAKFGGLELTPRYCDKRPPEEFPETTAFVEIVDKSAKNQSDYKNAAPAEGEPAPVAETAAPAPASASALPEGMVFSGWMFKSSPALNGVQHPVYDVWVIDCKTVNVDN
ncbi:MAG: hypothetical protein A3E78_07345 [Alphaproteobacteria bacterium RIFCSPHIGHO2_12_FULL_63_12]|nr:MAG: hypothetical protein A3E78_07345 [Alphaproteobacteria bacterium RIFCSPHIGHO2_12_FULL_63_12]